MQINSEGDVLDLLNGDIRPLCENTMQSARERMDHLVKPIGSLGILEAWAVRLCGITGKLRNAPSCLGHAVFAADNGVLEEGVTPVPQAVTVQQLRNMASGCAGISVLLKSVPSHSLWVDVGMAQPGVHEQILDMHVCRSTRNIAKEAAMTKNQAMDAMRAGARCAEMLHAQGCDVLSAGEMGIGNTTTSAAVIAVLTGLHPQYVTGRGSGIDESTYNHKIEVVQRAIRTNAPDAGDPLEVLYKVGGADIAAMAGFYIQAALLGRPILLDGVISVAAALIAQRMHTRVQDYMFASHRSSEPGYEAAADALGVQPVLHLDMRLGEGTGCPFAFFLLCNAARLLNDMGTLDEGRIAVESLYDMRKDKDR